MHLPMELKQSLQLQSVFIDQPAISAFSQDPHYLVEELKSWCGTETDGVAVSYLFRQFALFVSAQFSLIHQYGGYFQTAPDSIIFSRFSNYGLPLMAFHVESADFTEVPKERRGEAFHYVLLQQTDALLQEVRKHAKISPIICWENVLGSLAWYYANLQRNNPRLVAEDLEWLMDEKNWLPLRKSHWREFIGQTPLERAVSTPMRKTCCLYKELPVFGTCTFCPQPG